MRARRASTAWALVLSFVLLATMIACSDHAYAGISGLQFSVSPSEIDRDYTGAVTLDVTHNVTLYNVLFELFVDVDEDGTLDAGDDPLVWSYQAYDGAGSTGSAFPDLAASNTLRIQVGARLFTPLGFPYASGHYIFRVAHFHPIAWVYEYSSQPFTVLRGPQEAQGVAVHAEDTGGTPVGGALAMLWPAEEDCDGPIYSGFTNSFGDVDIPFPESDTCKARIVMVAKPQMLPASPPEFVTFAVGEHHDVTATLRTGSVPVSGVLAFAPGGWVGVRSALMVAEGPGGLAIAFTNSDGSGEFSFLLDEGEWRVFAAEPVNLALQGAIAFDETSSTTVTVTAPSTDAGTLLVEQADAWISGMVVAPDGLGGLTPQAGVRVEGWSSVDMDSGYDAGWVTDSTGAYLMPVFVEQQEMPTSAPAPTLQTAPSGPRTNLGRGGSTNFRLEPPTTTPELESESATRTWYVQLDMPPAGFITSSMEVTVTTGSTAIDRHFTLLEPTAWIRGKLETLSGDACFAYCLSAETTSGPTHYESRATVACDGTYEIPVVDGTWNVRLDGDDMFADFLPFEPPRIDEQVVVAGGDIAAPTTFITPQSSDFTITTISGSNARPGGQILIEGFNFPASTPDVWVGGSSALVNDYRPDLGKMIVTVPIDATTGFGAEVIVSDGTVSATSCVHLADDPSPAPCPIMIDSTMMASGLVVFFDENDEFFHAVQTFGHSIADVPLEGDSGAVTAVLVPDDGSVPVTPSLDSVMCFGMAMFMPPPFVTVSGIVQRSDDSEPVAQVLVEARSPSGEWFDAVLTDDEGAFSFRVPEHMWFDLRFVPPYGSRLVAAVLDGQVVETTDVTLPAIELSQGSIVTGTVVDADGEGLSTEIHGFDHTSGDLLGGGMSLSCSGHFAFAVDPGEIDLRLDSATGVATLVSTLDATADVRLPIDAPVFRAEPLDGWDGRLRLGPEGSSQAHVGDDVFFFIEGLGEIPWSSYNFQFGTSAPEFAPPSHLDTDRGVALVNVPTGAESGAVSIASVGRISPLVPFEILDGSATPGAYTLDLAVNDSTGTPITGALVMMLAPSDAANEDSPLRVVSWNYSGSSGAPLLHDGDPDLPLIILVLPPSLDTPGGLIETALGPSNSSLTWTAPASVATLAGTIYDEGQLSVIPRARVIVEGGEFFDTRVTDASGAFSMAVPADIPLEIEVIPPAGSRFIAYDGEIASGGGTITPTIELQTGHMLTSGLVDESGAPFASVGISAYGSSDPWPSYFHASTSARGTFSGPIPPLVDFNISIEPPLGFAGKNLSMTQLPGDLIALPLTRILEGGSVSGSIKRGDTHAALPNAGLTFYAWSGGELGDPVLYEAAEDDGTFALTLEPGTYVVQGFPNDGDPCMQAWYESGGSAACALEATTIDVVKGGSVTDVDVVLPLASTISGSVTEYLAPSAGASIVVSEGDLGTCTLSTMTDINGDYTLTVPVGTGYEASVTTGGGSQTMCWEDDHLCISPSTFATSGSVAFVANFEFGTTPGEVDATQLGSLGVEKRPGGTIGVVFDALAGGEPRVDSYNVYEGALGTYTGTIVKSCRLEQNTDLEDLGGGRWRYDLTPGSGSTWYLVSASNILGEGSLGGSRALGDPCGATTVQVSTVPASPDRPQPQAAGIGAGDTPSSSDLVLPIETAPSRPISHPAFGALAWRGALTPARLVRGKLDSEAIRALWIARDQGIDAWVANLQAHRQVLAIDAINAAIRLDGSSWASLAARERKNAARAFADWLEEKTAVKRFSLIDARTGEELGRWRGWRGLRERKQ